MQYSFLSAQEVLREHPTTSLETALHTKLSYLLDYVDCLHREIETAQHSKDLTAIDCDDGEEYEVPSPLGAFINLISEYMYDYIP